MLDVLPPEEVAYQSEMLKCSAHPRLILDKPLLESELNRIEELKASTLNAAAARHNCTPLQFKTLLLSNQKFASLLQEYGCPVPMKVSKATGKEAPALAKTDEGFQALLEHDDPTIQIFATARNGNKSTNEESKVSRLIELADLGPLPVSYLISGAHTSRLSGTQKINLQNLSSGRVPGTSNACRRAIMAPEGNILVSVDSSGCELRTLASICDDTKLIQSFLNKRDIYIEMAASAFGRNYDELYAAHKAGDRDAGLSRQIGKTITLGCGYGSGAVGFQRFARTTAKMDIDIDQAKQYVYAYREARHLVPQMWKTCDFVLRALIAGEQGTFGGSDGKMFEYDGRREIFGMRMPGVRLPDGIWINYFEIREEEAPLVPEGEYQRKTQIVYSTVKGRSRIPTKTYGSKLFENVNQGLAYAAIKYQMRQIAERYPIAMSTHDEAVFIAPESEAEEAKAFALECFSTVPPWLGDCPLVGEAGYAKRYGDA
jgi:hypothetical protein